MTMLELEPPLDPCRSYSFLYPGCRSLEPRRLLVMRVRDINDGERPQVEWLVTGIDLDRQAEESFYFKAMQDVRPLARPAALMMLDRLVA